MARFDELFEKYRVYSEALEEYEAARKVNEGVESEVTTLKGKLSGVESEIHRLREIEAKKVWDTMEKGRFSYEVTETSEEIDRGTLGDFTRYYNLSTMSLSVMGLKIPISREDINHNKEPLSGEQVLAMGCLNPRGVASGLIEKFEFDPVGTKKAVCETVRVKMMKDAAGLPVEIKAIDRELAEMRARLSKLEKLVEEEVPDNAIMRKIFKKKFEAIEKAPKEIETVKAQIAVLESKKENYEYRLSVAKQMDSPEVIEKYVEDEYKFLKAFIERDYETEVSQTSTELVAQAESIKAEIKTAGAGRVDTWDKNCKARKLKEAVDADYKALFELFDNKEFVEELRSYDVSKLSEEERKMVEVVREQYEQYLLKTVQKYEG